MSLPEYPSHAFLVRQIAARGDRGPWSCDDHWRVKQRNYLGSADGDGWYYMLVWCSRCRMHHEMRKPSSGPVGTETTRT